MLSSLKKNLVAGLAILLPIAITIGLTSFLINLLTRPFMSLISSILIKLHFMYPQVLFPSSEQTLMVISKLVILILLFVFIVVLGFLARLFVIKFFLSLTDKIVHKIPVVSTIYKASQEIIKTFFKPDQTSFRQVVMVPFPHAGIYVLGLVSKESPAACSESIGTPLVSVLIPTAPSPISGFLLMYPNDQLIPLDMKPETALKYIISGGVLTP